MVIFICRAGSLAELPCMDKVNQRFARLLLAEPAGGLGDAPLVFAGVLADEEWEVPFAVQREDGSQNLAEGVEGLRRLAK